MLFITKKHNVIVEIFSANIGFYLFKDSMVNKIETFFNTKHKSITCFTDTIGYFRKKRY
jgi:hypothetical protein